MVEITDQTFKEEALQGEIPVLVDFWAPWCGPCQMVAPIIEALSKEYEGKVKIGKINVDENPETPQKYAIMSIPTVVIFKDGKEVQRLVGYVEKKEYKKLIEEVLK